MNINFQKLCITMIYLILTTSAQHYINQDNQNTSPDGSHENPFISLNQAVDTLQSGVFELILLGEKLLITSPITIPPKSNYQIRSSINYDSNESFFLLQFQQGAGFSVSEATLTLQGVQIIESPQQQNSPKSTIILQDASLSLNRILVKDIDYSVGNYPFISSSSTIADVYVNISECAFKNLRDVKIEVDVQNLSISQTLFSDITQTQGSLISLSSETNLGLMFLFQDNIMDSMVIENRVIDSLTYFMRLGSGISEVTLRNLTVSNSHAMEDCFFVSVISDPISQESSSLTIKDLSIENSTDLLFLAKGINDITLTDIELFNSSYEASNQEYSLFSLEEGDTLTINNITGSDLIGLIWRIINIQKISVSSCNFTRLSTTNDTTLGDQSFFNITVNTVKDGVDTLITIDHFYTSGFSITEQSSAATINRSSLLYFSVASGEVYLRDSYWIDVETDSITANTMKFMEINNLTIDSTLSTTYISTPQHKLLTFNELDTLNVLNSQFLNNQNVQILSLLGRHLTSLFDSLSTMTILFDNLALTNNSANLSSTDLEYSSLFRLYNPLLITSITLNNSIIQDNSATNSGKVNIMMSMNTFQGNFATKSGTIYTAEALLTGTSSIDIESNSFLNNICLGNGGLFSFVSVVHDFYAIGNDYENNFAATDGGIGYILHSKINFDEKYGNYYNNSAGRNGGAWFISTKYLNSQEYNIVFTGVWFMSSFASEKGGTIYVATGNINFQDCVFDVSFLFSSPSLFSQLSLLFSLLNYKFAKRFKDSQALEAGGIAYLVSLSSVQFARSGFMSYDSASGALIYAESLYNQSITFDMAMVFSKDTANLKAAMVDISSGTLNVVNSRFLYIKQSMFRLKSTIAIFDNNDFNHIDCMTQISSFCLVSAISSSLYFRNSQLRFYTLNEDMFLLHACKEVVFDNVHMSKVSSNVPPTNQTIQQFVLRIQSTPSVTISSSSFSIINMTSGMRAKKSNISISDTIFEFDCDQSGLPEIETPEVLELGSGKSKLIVMEACNSSISDSVLQSNIFGVESNGGVNTFFAIQIEGIEGIQGYHYITKTKFKNNFAQYGGAISVNGTIGSIIIDSCQFRLNIASLGGGSIFFNNKSSIGLAIIRNSYFYQDISLRGGSIYVEGQKIILLNNTFEDCFAIKEGGAFLSYNQGPNKTIVQNCSFLGNGANVGGAIMIYGKQDLVKQDCIFLNNAANYTNDIATEPHQLGVKIHKFDELLKYLYDNLSPQLIQSDKNTKLIYSSRDQLQHHNITQKSGIVPDYLFEFNFLDYFNQTVPFDSHSSLQLSAVESSTLTESKVGLLNQKDYNLRNNVTYIYNSFSVRGDDGSSITLSATATFMNGLTNQVESLPPTNMDINLVPCSQGEIYDTINKICVACKEGTYTLKGPFEAQSCQTCPEELECLGGNMILPHKGYWKSSAISDNIVKCSSDEACIGGRLSINGRMEISLTGFCGKGYQGIACSACEPYYIRSEDNLRCVALEDIGEKYTAKFIGLLTLQIVLMVLMIKTWDMKYTIRNEDKSVRVMPKSTVIKILIDFAHCVILASECNLEWHKAVKVLFVVVAAVLPNSRYTFSSNYFITSVRGTNQGEFFIKSLILLLQPVFFILIGIIIWIVIYKMKSQRIIKNTFLIKKIKYTAITILYVFQIDAIKTALSFFRISCENYGPIASSKLQLIEDNQVECWKGKHMSWALGLGLPAVVFWFIVPNIWLIVVVLQKWRTRSNSNNSQNHGIIFDQYKNRYFYWEATVSLRKTLLVLIVVLLKTNPYLQSYLSLSIVCLSSLLQIFWKPFSNSKLDSFEKACLLILSFLFYTELFYISVSNSNYVSVRMIICLNVFIAILSFKYLMTKIIHLVRKAHISRRNPCLKRLLRSKSSKLEDVPEIGKTSYDTPFLSSSGSNLHLMIKSQTGLESLQIDSPKIELKSFVFFEDSLVNRILTPKRNACILNNIDTNDRLDSPQRFDSLSPQLFPTYRTTSESQRLTLSEKTSRLLNPPKYKRKVENAGLIPSRMKSPLSRGVLMSKELNVVSKDSPLENNPKLISMSEEVVNSASQIESVEHISEGIQEFDDSLNKKKNATVQFSLQSPKFIRNIPKV